MPILAMTCFPAAVQRSCLTCSILALMNLESFPHPQHKCKTQVQTNTMISCRGTAAVKKLRLCEGPSMLASKPLGNLSGFGTLRRERVVSQSRSISSFQKISPMRIFTHEKSARISDCQQRLVIGFYR